MNNPVRILFAIGAGTTIASCAPQAAYTAAPLTAEQTQTLERELGGKVAGAPINCLPPGADTMSTVRVSQDILLYRRSGSLVYRNDLPRACPGIDDNDNIIIADTVKNGLCDGDLIRLVNRASGIQGSTCSLGEFTPYRTPG